MYDFNGVESSESVFDEDSIAIVRSYDSYGILFYYAAGILSGNISSSSLL